MSLHIIFQLFLDAYNLWLIFNNFLLRISHYFILLYLLLDDINPLLDRLTILFKKLKTMIDEFVFSFV